MKQHIITTYSFDELSEEAQEKAIENLYNVNVDYDWYDFIYSEIEELGMKCEGFDIYSYCTLKFYDKMSDIAKSIVENHGKECETYKDAKNYLDEYEPLQKRLERLHDIYEYFMFRDDWENMSFNAYNELDKCENELEELNEEFQNNLKEDYRIILKNEYECLTSKESIKETIKANDYQFLENGKHFI